MLNAAQIRGDLSDPDYYAPMSSLTRVSDPDYWHHQAQTGILPYYAATGGDASGFFDFIAAPFKAIGSAVSTIASPVLSAVKTIASPVLQAVETVTSPILKPVLGAIAPVLGAITQNPLFDIVKTGVSFIPGVGTAVSAGMGALAAAGRGQGLTDIALQAAKSAVPGGPAVQSALDVAIGALQGRDVADSVLATIKDKLPGGEIAKAVFDAGTAIARGQSADQAILNQLRAKLPGGELGRQAFDAAIAAHQSANAPASVTFPALSAQHQRVTRTWQRMGRRGLQMPIRTVARTVGVPTNMVRQVGSAFLNRWAGSPSATSMTNIGEADSLEQAASAMGIPIEEGDFSPRGTGEMTFAKIKTIPKFTLVLTPTFTQALYDKGTPNMRKAILAHGLLARLSQSTGELDNTGGWIIRSGDTGFGIAKKVTNDGSRWKEILPVNPGMSTYTDSNGATQIKPWKIGQRVILPPSWLGTAAPVPAQLPLPASVSIPGIGTVALPSLPVSTAPIPVPTAPGAARTYVVQSGDSLWKIAQKYTGDGSRWKELYAMPVNAKTIGPDPNKINMGQKLVIPDSWPSSGGATLPSVTPPIIPLPAPGPAVPSTSPDPTTGAVQTMLAFFCNRHGGEIPIGAFSSSSTVPFGTDPDDLGGVWDDRCEEATLGFQGWANAHPRPNSTPLPTTGQPDQATVAALQAQNAADLAAMAGGTPMPTPTPTVTPVLPGLPGLPAIVPPAWSEQPTGGAAPGSAQAAIPLPGGQVATAGVAPAAKKGDGMGLLLLAGGALLLFGGGFGAGRARRAA